MSKVKLEVYFSASDNANDRRLAALLNEIRQELADRVEIISTRGRDTLNDGFKLTAMPAVVIEETIKIIGFCPSKETLIHALKESGLDSG